MFDEKVKKEIREFLNPFYDRKDMMHGIKHVERIFKEADNLLLKYPQADKDVVFAACYFHGIVYNNEAIIRSFLKGLNINEEQIDRIVTAAFDSQVKSIPETLEGKITHDAHMIEGGKTFLVVKSLVTGTARGQSLEETIEYLNTNILNKGQCYLDEAIVKYLKKQEYLKDFMESILVELNNSRLQSK
ncbi:MAG: hypothetical protein FIA99_19950 [Ruminiclostridium sp.]|nr:hypothetical protein [Ruminiclostridium sp.]